MSGGEERRAEVSDFQQSAEWADLCSSRWGLGLSVMRVRDKPNVDGFLHTQQLYRRLQSVRRNAVGKTSAPGLRSPWVRL